jgi:C4-dicarboxylate-specific signal transduction histidine kinase
MTPAEAMDGTERENLTQELRRREAYLGEAQRLSHTGSFGWRVATGEIFWSEETFRIFQYDPTLKPTAELVLQRVHPEDAALVKQNSERAAQDGKPFDLEHRLLMPDGSVTHVHVVAHALRDESGGTEYVGAVMDITEQRRAEMLHEQAQQVLRESEEQWKKDITEQKRTEAALQKAQADLAHVSQLTSLGELTASLAHEVNQPIAAAVTNANACLRWLAGDAPNLEEARAAAARIVKDGTRAAEIISRTRLLYKKATPQRELVDVNELTREIIVLLGSETTRYSVTVRTELAADLPRVMGDRVQLQQVMMNLIVNGIEATREVDGAREIAIKSQRAENEQLLVSVSDTGVGLPPQPDQIFNAFFTTKLDGTGLGLSISRSIVESHGGRLWAADNPPRGATFSLTLPTKG